MSHRDPVPTPPILPDRLGVALGRLQAALGRLRAAALLRSPVGDGEPDAPAPVADDPHPLAAERDAALARAEALQAAGAAALERLERAETAIAAVMQGLLRQEGGDPHPAPPGTP